MYQKILVPTDGSSIATAAARAGVEFARQCGAEVIGVFVAPEFQYPIYLETIPSDFQTQEEYMASMRKAGEAYLGEIKKAADASGVKFTPEILFSDKTAQQIVETAKKNGCDLIFMGSHGRSGWGQLLLGSVTSKVLAMCELPVLVYRLTKQPAR